MTLLHSPLDAAHRALGARMAEFGGWEMPIQYTGVLEEHRACRNGAVVFDVSHLGSVRVHGAGAFATLQWAFTNDLDRIAPGRAQYTHLLDADDAHVVDDLIIWWTAPGDFLVMPNASNTAPLVDALGEAAIFFGGGECEITEVTAERVVLAVQGPEARARLATISPDHARVARFGVEPLDFGGATRLDRGHRVHRRGRRRAARPGRGRRAVLGAPPRRRGHARRPRRARHAAPRSRPAVARPRAGPGITPLQAGLGWVVRFDKDEFRGRQPLTEENARGVARRLRGLRLDGRQIPREGHAVLRAGTAIGAVTSGNFSPVLECGIALAFVPPDVLIGDTLAVDVRGREVPPRSCVFPSWHPPNLASEHPADPSG